MKRAVHVTWALAATLSACFSPQPPPEAPPREPEPAAPPALAAPAIAAPPVDPGPSYAVTVLVGGAPKATPAGDLSALGSDSVDYLGTCTDADHRTNDTLQWDAASRAPLCVRLVFAPPASLPTSAGTEVKAGELLVPLGMPQLDGFVLVRSGGDASGGFLRGDPALLARIKQRAAGALASLPTRAPNLVAASR